ncbi:hypothetical protein BHE74_00002344 [Ensete ventricosum]|nr:hypothetical protein BHE74_00002344 [Ensete ventricosum]
MATPAKRSQAPRRQTSEIPKLSENLDPNLLSTPCRRSTKSPATNSARPKKSASRTPVRIPSSSPSPAKDKSLVAPEKSSVTPFKSLDPEKCHQVVARLKENAIGSERLTVEDMEVTDSRARARAMKQLLLEEAMSGLPESGAGRVTYLVNAFERLLSISKEPKGEDGGEVKRKVMNWALPGMQQPPKAKVSENSCSPILCSTDFPPMEDSERDSAEHSSVSKKDKRSAIAFKFDFKQPFSASSLLSSAVSKHLPSSFRLSNGINGSDEGRRNRRNVAERLSFVEQIKLERERQQKLEEEEEIRRLRKELVPRAQPMPYFDRPFIPRK